MILQQKASSKELNFISAGRGDWINVFLVGVLRFYSGERRACQLNGSVGGGLHTRVRQTWGGGGETAGAVYLMLERENPPPLNARKESWRDAKNRKRQRLRVRADVGAGFCVSGEVR